MKSTTQFSMIGSLLLAFALAHVAARGQSSPTPGPEHEVLKKLEGIWNAKVKMVTHMPDDDHQIFTMYIIGADGQENKVMTIEYTRKK